MLLFRWLDRHFEYMLLALLLGALALFSFLNVALRYGFNSSILWSDEVCRYSLVLSGFFSIPCWLRHRTGLRVDVFLLMMSEKTRRVLEYVVSVVMLLLFGYLAYGASLVASHAARINLLSPTLRFPLAYLYGAIVFAFVLSCVRLVQAMVWRDRDEKESKQ